MSYLTRAYDNEHGDPVVVLVAEGTHDVGRLTGLLATGLCEQGSLARTILRQVRRHNGGRAALQMLAAHGGPDLLHDVAKVEAGQEGGPWVAVLADRHGDVYPTFAQAAEVLPDDAEMMIRIVRGTALPVADEIDGGLRVAQEYNVVDLAYETDAYLTDPDDLSQGAEVQYTQAQAMAHGLNAAAGVSA